MEVFRIVKVQKTNSVTYLLEDYCGKPVAGGFYEYELHRAINPDVYIVEKMLSKKGNDVYVKWLKFDNSHSSWIHIQGQCVINECISINYILVYIYYNLQTCNEIFLIKRIHNINIQK